MADRPESIRVVGLARLRRELARVDKTLPKELAKLNFKAADIVAKDAKLRAPKGKHQGGGQIIPIRRSIKALKRSGTSAQVAMGGVRTPHAEVTEFGGEIPRRGSSREAIERAQAQHQSFRRAGVTRRTKITARPFLYPAIDAKRDEVVELYEQGIEDLFNKIPQEE
ncbi:MAG TPA: hypothetical protein VIR27_16585 [Mycobacteriales bacterium]|jgi:Bacteriophage protein of unknown function (DUF646).